MINICIVGLGSISPLHIDAINQNKNLRLYAVCDNDAAKLENFNLDVVKYEHFDKAIEDEKIESFHLLTPHFLHAEMIIKGLNNNKHIFSEKPLCINEKEIEEIKTAVDFSDSKFGLCFQNRYRYAIKKLKEIINSKDLGSCLAFNANVMWERTADYYKTASWRGKWATEGGGVMINQAIHTLDLLVYLLGDLKLKSCLINNISLKNCIEVEDTANLTFKIPNGNYGFFTATNAYKGNLPVHIEFEFEKGKAIYNEDLKVYKDGKLILNTALETGLGEKAYWGDFHKDVINDFYNHIIQNTFFVNSYDNIIKTHNLLFDIYASSALSTSNQNTTPSLTL